MSRSLPIWITSKTKLFYDSYTIGKQINKGEYATIYDCAKKQDADNKYVVKCVNKMHILTLPYKEQALVVNNLKKEIKSLQAVYGHEHIIKLEQVYEDENNLFLVFEKCHGGELYDYILSCGKLSEKQAKIIMKQLLSTVHDLHEKYHIYHGDLKPSNILLANTPVYCHSHNCLQKEKRQEQQQDQKNDTFVIQSTSCSYCKIQQTMDIDEYNLQIKIIDFGFSKNLKPFQYLSSLSGSIHYTAPELIILHKHDHSADCWSLGIILFVMLYGYLPFYISPSTCSSLNEETTRTLKLISLGFHSAIMDVKIHGHGPFFS